MLIKFKSTKGTRKIDFLFQYFVILCELRLCGIENQCTLDHHSFIGSSREYFGLFAGGEISGALLDILFVFKCLGFLSRNTL